MMPLWVQVAPLSLVDRKKERSTPWPLRSSLIGRTKVPSFRNIVRFRGSQPNVSWKKGLSSVHVRPLSEEVRKNSVQSFQPVPRNIGCVPSMRPQTSHTRLSRVVNNTALPGG